MTKRSSQSMDRRQAMIGVSVTVMAGTATPAREQTGSLPTEATGRLQARPHPPSLGAASGPLGLARRDADLFVPDGLEPGTPAPLLLALHGATQSGLSILRTLRAEAQRRGVVIVAPDSRGRTWTLDDGGPIGANAAFIDRALAATFDRVLIERARIAVIGFSDGASYALSTGMVNGDLFSHVLAHAPLRFEASVSVGRPRFFISIGRNDDVSGPTNVEGMAQQLEAFGYDVALHRHRGGHQIGRRGLREGLDRFLG